MSFSKKNTKINLVLVATFVAAFVATFEVDSVTDPYSPQRCWGLCGWLDDGCTDCSTQFDKSRVTKLISEEDWKSVKKGKRPKNVVCVIDLRFIMYYLMLWRSDLRDLWYVTMAEYHTLHAASQKRQITKSKKTSGKMLIYLR